MLLIKAIATALFLALVGLLIGPFVGLFVVPAPAEACGMWWLAAMATGGMWGALIGAGVGFVLGLIS